MCIIFFAYKSHPNYRLIVAANRDERYARPTDRAHFWHDEPNILAGRDLEKMGSWLGITKTGRFAALTNFRNPNENQQNKQSRGQIVRNFLAGNESPRDFLVQLQQERNNYPGFNALTGNDDSLVYYSNYENEIKQLNPGIYGLSNHLLDTPWPKIEKGKRRMEALLQHRTVGVNDLFDLLKDAEPAPKHKLPNTGVPKDLEKQLSSIFIKTPHYGTRCSTIITVDHSGNVFFSERTFPNRNNLNDRTFQFQI